MNIYIREIRESFGKIKENYEELLHKTNLLEDMCIAYFTHSISISTYNEDDHMVIGHFHIMNIGNTTIHQPLVFLRINCDDDFKFSGKFASGEGQVNSAIHEWEKIKLEEDTKGEYCFKPLKLKDIPPKGKLVFPDFQIRFSTSNMSSLSVQGFVYFNESQETINALNMVNISV